MPIVIEAVSLESYLLWLSSQNSPLNPSLSPRVSWTKQLLTFPTSRGYHTSTPTPRLSRAELKAIIVTPEQHEVIIGCLLGDMCATRPEGNKRNTRLFFGQSESNAAYLEELFTLLSSLIRQHAPTPTRRVDKITGKLSTGFQFLTRSLPCLNLYREWFYPQGTKIVPTNIADHLTDQGLAHWFMQDGSKTSDNGVTFATHCFTETERNLLIEVLSSKFGLNCTQQQMGGKKGQRALYVRRKSIPHLGPGLSQGQGFLELVRPYMHSSMLYKLPIK